jgi:hypothetical protein
MKKGKKQRGATQPTNPTKTKIKNLTQKLKLLKKLPDDFRDLVVGEKLWNERKSLYGPEEAIRMENWAKGKVALLLDEDITRSEWWHLFGTPDMQDKSRAYVLESRCLHKYSLDELLLVLKCLNEQNFSWLYIQLAPLEIVRALNTLLSAGQYTIRCKTLPRNNKTWKMRSVANANQQVAAVDEVGA